MVEKEEARKIALDYLVQVSSDHGIEVCISGDIQENDDGFIVRYNSKEWIENRTLSAALMGNLPLLIDKQTGEVTFFSG